MRALLVIGVLGLLAALSVPLVFADGGQDETAANGCQGTFGEYRVHCLSHQQYWAG